MRAKLIGIIVLIAVFLVFTAYSFGVFRIPEFTSHYKIGEEIKSFPVDELSITFVNYTTAKSVTDVPNIQEASPDNKYVIFTVTIKNLANHELYFNRKDDFNDRLTYAKVNSFILKYGEMEYEKYPIIVNYIERVPTNIFGGFEPKFISLDWGMGITMTNAPEITSIAPNQILTGKLYYIIGEYYNPNELVCRFSLEKTLFIIDLNS